MAAGAVAVALFDHAGAKSAAATRPVREASAPVIKTDLTEQDQVDGTLGYAGSYPVTASGGGRTLTWLPAVGRTVTRGGSVYRADNRPVTLLYGSTPFWRELSTEVSDGEDVRELKRNLKALGYGSKLADDKHFSSGTAEAVKRWQKAQGVPKTGTVAVGDVVVEPSAIRVTSLTGTVGSTLQGVVLTATSTRRVVSVDLEATKASLAKQGAHVSVKLPGGKTTPGVVSEVGTVAKAPASAGGQDASQSASSTDKATIAVQVTLDQPGDAGRLDGAPVTVSFTSSEHKNVLAVPVTALLATAQGGYAVQVLADDGSRLVPVSLGIFDNGNVEVSGPDLHEGVKVAVASS